MTERMGVFIHWIFFAVYLNQSYVPVFYNVLPNLSTTRNFYALEVPMHHVHTRTVKQVQICHLQFPIIRIKSIRILDRQIQISTKQNKKKNIWWNFVKLKLSFIKPVCVNVNYLYWGKPKNDCLPWSALKVAIFRSDLSLFVVKIYRSYHEILQNLCEFLK